VAVTGGGFTGVTAVMFGSTSVTSFIVNGPTSITAIAPPGSAEVVDLTVTTPNGTSTTASKDQYKYENPTVTGVSPDNGPVGGGASVTITGSGFAQGAGATTFKFGTALGSAVYCAATTICTMVTAPVRKAATVDVIAAVGKLKSSKEPAGDRYTYR